MNNLIITGIVRSGMSLFSTLINLFEDTICLSEVLYDRDTGCSQ